MTDQPTDPPAGWVTLREGTDTEPPIRVRVIIDPDPALARVIELALLLSPGPVPAPTLESTELADELLALHLYLTQGGPLPTPWAAALPGGTDRVTAPARLPGDPGPLGDEPLMLLAAIAARTVAREHQPHTSRRSRTAAPSDYCTRCGQEWPCQPRTMAAALNRALPWWRWAAGNAGTLRQALYDAACYVDEHGLSRAGNRDYNPVANRLGELDH